MTISRHRGSLIWIAVFAAASAVFSASAGYGFDCARTGNEVCLSVWGLAAGTVAVYAWVFGGLALLALGAAVLLASSELVLRDDGLTLRYWRWRREYPVAELKDFEFAYRSFMRMYRIRSATAQRTLVLINMFARFDEVEQWLTRHLEARR